MFPARAEVLGYWRSMMAAKYADWVAMVCPRHRLGSSTAIFEPAIHGARTWLFRLVAKAEAARLGDNDEHKHEYKTEC
jgi:hypothetical protein